MATFFLREVFRITGLGVVVVGEVKSGVLRPGMKTNVGGKSMEIKAMEMKHEQLTEAKEGNKAGIHLKNGDYDFLKDIRKSDIQFF